MRGFIEFAVALVLSSIIILGLQSDNLYFNVIGGFLTGGVCTFSVIVIGKLLKEK